MSEVNYCLDIVDECKKFNNCILNLEQNTNGNHVCVLKKIIQLKMFGYK